MIEDGEAPNTSSFYFWLVIIKTYLNIIFIAFVIFTILKNSVTHNRCNLFPQGEHLNIERGKLCTYMTISVNKDNNNMLHLFR